MDHDFNGRRARAARACGVLVSVGLSTSGVASAASPASTSPEQGFDLGTIQNPRNVAMGGAQTATGGSVNALYNNPANMALERVYHIEGIIDYAPEAQRLSFAGGIVDSAMNSARLAGGFGGAWNQQDNGGIGRKWAEGRLALAYPFGDRFAIGLAGRYIAVSQAVASGPFGASFASDGTPASALFKGITFDAGATLSLLQGLRLGVVGHNLTTTNNPLIPMTAEAGLGYGYKPPGEDTRPLFTVEAAGLLDVATWNAPRYRLMFGGELLIVDHVLIRAGLRYDQATDATAVGVGTGYIDRQWSVEAAVRQDVTGLHPNTMVSLSLKLFYDPMSPAGSAGMGM